MVRGKLNPQSSLALRQRWVLCCDSGFVCKMSMCEWMKGIGEAAVCPHTGVTVE